MPAVMIEHKVADFDTWLAAYETHEPMRKAAGETKSIVWQDADDPNNVIALIKFASLDQARAFSSSADLKDAMQQAGVAEQPTLYFLDNPRKYVDA